MAEENDEAPTYTYAPWQLQEVRRQFRRNLARDGVDECVSRAARMSNLPARTVRLLMENDETLAAIVAGEPEPDREEKVHKVPPPPAARE